MSKCQFLYLDNRQGVIVSARGQSAKGPRNGAELARTDGVCLVFGWKRCTGFTISGQVGDGMSWGLVGGRVVFGGARCPGDRIPVRGCLSGRVVTEHTCSYGVAWPETFGNRRMHCFVCGRLIWVGQGRTGRTWGRRVLFDLDHKQVVRR